MDPKLNIDSCASMSSSLARSACLFSFSRMWEFCVCEVCVCVCVFNFFMVEKRLCGSGPICLAALFFSNTLSYFSILTKTSQLAALSHSCLPNIKLLPKTANCKYTSKVF